MEFDTEHTMKRYEVERKEKWRDLVKDIPYLQFPAEWKVKIIPPFGGATARFTVRTDAMPEDSCISIYLDHYARLGCMGKPYWECYPNAEGDDTARFYMEDTEGLLSEISNAIVRLSTN